MFGLTLQRGCRLRIVGATGFFARVAELADAYGSGPYGETRGGSSPLASSPKLPSGLNPNKNYRQAADIGPIDRLFSSRSFPARGPASLHQLREPSTPGCCKSAFLFRRGCFCSSTFSSRGPAGPHELRELLSTGRRKCTFFLGGGWFAPTF